jgi:hypothetical protein
MAIEHTPDEYMADGWWTENGWARKGSQLQIQLYVNRRPRELTRQILEAFPELAKRVSDLEWRAPLETAGFQEPQDVRFLSAIGREALSGRLAEFWPTRGPVWDALAVGASGEVVLVEAKSHPAEIYGGGTKASPASRQRIEKALRETQRELGISEAPEQWLDPLRPDDPGHSSVYQSANRYAHLHWLRGEGVEAWLVHVLITDDPTWKPTSREVWEEALPGIEHDLGLGSADTPYADHVFLPGRLPDDVLTVVPG